MEGDLLARLNKNTLSEYESTLEACKQELENLHDRTSVVETLVSEIIYDKCKDIDELIHQIKEAVYDVDSIADYQLDIFIAKIPIQLYYLSAVMSSFQTSESVAKLSQKVAYNDARMKAEGTVADKDAIAERAVETETLVTLVTTRCTKMMQMKYDMALELLNSLKKISSRRISEYELTRFSRDS